MTDGTMGCKQWHMNFRPYGIQFDSSQEKRVFYIINNGWREFAYEHNLKANDRLLFTLLTMSPFLVQILATSTTSA